MHVPSDEGDAGDALGWARPQGALGPASSKTTKGDRRSKRTAKKRRGCEDDDWGEGISNGFGLKFPLEGRAVVDPGRGQGCAGE